MTTTKRTERQVRYKPDASLPSVDRVMEQVSKAHGVEALKDAGVIKLSGTIQMGPLGFKGKIRQWFNSRCSRTEIKMGLRSMVVITNGDEVAASAGLTGSVERMEGLAREQEVLGHPAIHYGGWRQAYAQLDVMKEIQRSNGEPAHALVVRATTPSLPGATLVVDGDTGLLMSDKRLLYVQGMGFVGAQSRYRDFRDVAGVKLPFNIETVHANPLLGRMVITFDTSESGLSAGDLFDLPTD